MSDLPLLRAVRRRLADGEPLRILIGHTLHAAVEIEPAPAFLAGLRASFLADVETQIAELTPPENPDGNIPPAAPSAAALERTA